MTAALKYLSQVTNEIFEARMQLAARRISHREQIFHRRAA